MGGILDRQPGARDRIPSVLNRAGHCSTPLELHLLQLTV